jgi:pilus assembly protein Flp/PilA
MTVCIADDRYLLILKDSTGAKTMKSYFQKLQAFFGDEQGATALEYGLMAALIAAVIVLAVTAIGQRVDLAFGKIRDAMPAS